jgi:RimJ/RimL family protein N-acetyltransferase
VEKKIIDEKLKKFIPDGYEENYIKAYRRCQDKPGGEIEIAHMFHFVVLIGLHRLMSSFWIEYISNEYKWWLKCDDVAVSLIHLWFCWQHAQNNDASIQILNMLHFEHGIRNNETWFVNHVNCDLMNTHLKQYIWHNPSINATIPTPTGPIISGQPEARFEAYARAYAGCGVYTTPAYRRSYARLYEAISCTIHATEQKYREHWLERPGDIVGRTVRLEPLDVDRHLEEFYAMTSGDSYGTDRVYDPNEIWAFWPEGPFRDSKEMRQSFVFQRRVNEAAFAIIEAVTDKILGVILITNDNPQNLTISIELPIVKRGSEGTVEPIEGCFLLMDRLFATGYRRIELSIDSMDYNGKRLSGR